MWFPPTVTVAPTSEPVTLAEARRQVKVDFTDDDTYLTDLIAVARNHVEKYCGQVLAGQTVEVETDSWCDMRHLSVGLVQSITSIAYTDTTGAPQTLPDTVYELRGDAIVLKYRQSWPSVQPRSLITVSAVVGPSSIEPSVKHAMLVRIADLYESRENQDESGWTTFDSLLSNHRYY
ncbi:head-tail connector protein [Mesorhizobium cantuariense]|uniref:Head-tail connector protein n=1 Tax=Mesorhizobium cantuariense TaxID=1300275 RepID=A0ABV7MXP8_9HYPH